MGNKNKKELQSGFTMIELAIAVFVMAALSVITVSNFRSGEKRQRLNIAADTITTAIRNAQNFTLTGKLIQNSPCVVTGVPNKTPQYYFVSINASGSISLSGYDKCNNSIVIETYTLPPQTQVKTANFAVDGTSVSSVSIKFTPPFAQGAVAINGGGYGVYNDVQIGVESLDTFVYRNVAYNTVSGKVDIGQIVSTAAAPPADTQAPSTPTGLTVTAISNSQIDLSWNASTDNVAVGGYKIFRGGSQISTTTNATYSDTGLAASTSYSYTVSAYDAASNNSAQSTSAGATTQATADTTAPTVPTGLSATTVSSTQINLSWTASTDAVGVTGYKINRGGAEIATSATTSYSNTGLSPSTLYSYTVSAYDAASNNSAQSSSASATTQAAPDTTAPTVPTGLSATAVSSSQINLSWTASTDAVGVTGYKIYQNGSGTEFATIASTSYSVTGLTPSTAYTYKVSAYDAASNNSAQSTSAGATTQAAAVVPTVTTPTVSGITSSGATLGANVTSLGVPASITARGTCWGTTAAPVTNCTAEGGTTTGVFTHARTGMSASTTYYYRGYATNATGTGYSADGTFTTSAAPDTTAPTVPTGLSATAVSSSQINLSWTASTDAVGVTGYKIYQNGSGTEFATIASTSYSVTGLTPSTAYTYKVSAYDAASNNSAQSTSAGATTQAAADTTPPSVSITAPSGGATVSGSSVTVSATASDNVGVVGVQFKLDGATLGSEDTLSPYSITWDTTTATNASHSLTAVARDAAGNSTTSTAISVTVNNAASGISYIGGSSIGATSFTSLPTHQAGDLILMFAYRDGSTTAPTVPSGWTSINSAGGGSSNGSVLAYKVATASGTASGTWTNASGLVVQIYRGQSASPIGGAASQNGSGTSVTYPAITMQVTNGTSWVASFAGHRNSNTNIQNAPTGMINRSSAINSTAAAEVAGHDTNGGVSSWTANSVAVGGTASGWMSRVVEIKD